MTPPLPGRRFLGACLAGATALVSWGLVEELRMRRRWGRT